MTIKINMGDGYIVDLLVYVFNLNLDQAEVYISKVLVHNHAGWTHFLRT